MGALVLALSSQMVAFLLGASDAVEWLGGAGLVIAAAAGITRHWLKKRTPSSAGHGADGGGAD
jgi:hypothetical protein